MIIILIIVNKIYHKGNNMTQFKLSSLDVSKVTFGSIKSPGVRMAKDGRKIVELSTIYVPPMADNPVRKKQKNAEHIQKLTQSLTNGIDYALMPPVVRWNPRIVDGVSYDYELICGNHRYEALTILGYKQWIFDVYEFALNGISYEDSVRTFQLQENDHRPALESSKDDVINVISRLISYGSTLVENTESSIGAYVDEFCPNMHHQTKSKVVRGAVGACGAYQDIVTFTAVDVDKWLHKNTSLTNKGDVDKRRNQHGWTVLEGYEYEYLVNATRKYAETGKESYFVCHTKAPTKQEDLNFKRQKIVNKFNSLEESLIEVVKFYNENNRFPWKVEGFLPQDRKKPENESQLVLL